MYIFIYLKHKESNVLRLMTLINCAKVFLVQQNIVETYVYAYNLYRSKMFVAHVFLIGGHIFKILINPCFRSNVAQPHQVE